MTIDKNAVESLAIENTLRDWYEAIHTHNMKAVADYLTPSFLIVEHTKLLNKAELIAYLESGITHGSQTAELTGFQTQVYGDVAWTTLHNFEVWTPNNGEPPIDFRFIETIIFQKVDGKWLIDRYHATNTNPQEPVS